MRLITERDKIRAVATHWNKVYGGPNWREMHKIGERLYALDLETATAAEVDAIIGNSSWTRQDDCDDCGAKESAVIEVGEQPDYESATARLCVACVHKAFELCKGL